MDDSVIGWLLGAVILTFLFQGEPNVFTVLQRWVIVNLG
jgi:hypothetical protein